MSWLMYATRSITRTIRPSSVCGSGARLEWRAIPSRTCSVRFSPAPSRSRLLDDPQRVLVVAKVAAEALFQAAVEHLLADVPERRVAEVVAEADRLRPGPRSGAARARPCARSSSPRACASAACGSGRRAARRTPASCASAGETPCSARSGRGRAGTACAARSPPPRARAAPGRSARPAARAAAPPARASARRSRPRRRPAALAMLTARLCHRPGDRRVSACRGAQRSLLPVSAPGVACAPVAPLRLRRRVLVVHRRPAARLRAGSARRPSRCAGPRRARAATRLAPPRRSATPWPGVVITQPVEDVLLGRASTWCTVPTCSPSDASTGTPFSST